MTAVDGFLRSIDDLVRSSIAVEIAKALAPDPDDDRSAETPATDSYAASSSSSQPAALTPAGLRLPTAVVDHADFETNQSVLKNVLIANPPTTSLLNAMTVAFKDAQTQLPGNLAARLGFAEEDAAQLLATSSPADRLRGKQLSPLQQVIQTTLNELADLSNGPQAAPSAQERAEAARMREQLAGNEGLPVRPHDAASKTSETNLVLHAALADGLLQTERTGILDSSILNAAMIPGWPFQLQGTAAELVAGSKVSEEDALTYLANLGADESLIEKLRKSKPPVGKKLLIYLATMLTALENVIDTIASELAMLAGDEKALEEKRASANSHGRAGARRRLYIE